MESSDPLKTPRGRGDPRSAADLVERFTAARQYRNQVEAFCRSIREGAPFPWRLEDAKGTQAMIDGVFAAGG